MKQVALCLAVVLFSATQCFADEAVIIALSGKAEVIRSEETMPARQGVRLQEGDALTVLQGKANLITSRGELQTLLKGSTFVVNNAAEGERRGLDQRLLASLAAAVGEHEKPTVKGMVRGGDGMQPVFPRNTVVFAKDLRFSWKAEGELEGMKLKLKKRNPRFAFSHGLEDGANEYMPSENAPVLEPSVPYYWKIEGYDILTGEPVETPLVWFQILSQDEEQKVRNEIAEINTRPELESEAKVILVAGVYTSWQLYGNALQELKSGLKERPDSGVLQSLRSAIEQKIGL